MSDHPTPPTALNTSVRFDCFGPAVDETFARIVLASGSAMGWTMTGDATAVEDVWSFAVLLPADVSAEELMGRVGRLIAEDHAMYDAFLTIEVDGDTVTLCRINDDPNRFKTSRGRS